MEKLVILGASGHGKVIADIAVRTGYKEIIFLDDNKDLTECAGFTVVGDSSEIEKYKDWDFIVAIGNVIMRQKYLEYLEQNNYRITTLIHPNAVISRRVSIGKGSVVMAGSVINSDTQIGKGCIVNTGASVDHDGVITDYVHISVGAHIAGTVNIGVRTWVGAGAIILNNISICADCMIGAGAVVINSIQEQGTYIGVPAKRLNER